MKITIDVRLFAEALSAASAAVPAKSPKPILQNTCLVADADGVVLMGTNLTVGIRRQVLGVRVAEPGAAILPRQVNQIVQVSRESELDLSIDDGQLVIGGERSRFVLPTEDPDLFPAVPDFAASGYRVAAAADLKRLIRRTIFATDADSTRYALGGCLVEADGGSLAFVATDGRRLARMQVPAEIEGEPGPIGSPVVPIKALRLIERSLEDDAPPVHLAIQATNAVLVRTEHAVIYSRLVEGRSPAWGQILPAGDPAATVPLEVGTFRNATERAAIVTSEESRGVDFRFASGTLELTSRGADTGKSRVELPIAYDGQGVEITFDPRYLVDMLKVLDDEAALVAYLVDGKTAAVFKTEDAYLYVVMPMTRGK